MRFVFLRHPEFLLSVSPLLYGYLTVAAGFLIAHIFLSASLFLTQGGVDKVAPEKSSCGCKNSRTYV